MHDLCGENPSKLDIWMGLARGHGISCSCAHRPLRRARNIRVPFPNPGHGRTFYAPLVPSAVRLDLKKGLDQSELDRQPE